MEVTKNTRLIKNVCAVSLFGALALGMFGCAAGSGNDNATSKASSNTPSATQSDNQGAKPTAQADSGKSATPAQPAAPNVTASQKSALSKAQSYLKIVGGFSYDSLVRQLETADKFSSEDATYAADQCGANWDEQAKSKAKSYMDTVGGFSHDSLVNQLEKADLFTPDQAETGAASVGL